MAREKKITVKPFLNRQLKSKRLKVGGRDLYPLYFRVVYDRKSTRFMASNNWFPESEEENLRELPGIKAMINAITKIVRRESELREDFEIKGVGDLVKSYLTDMKVSSYLTLEMLLSEHLSRVISNHDFNTWRAITDPKERIQKGIDLSGDDIPEMVMKSHVMLSILDQANIPNLTIYQWFFGSLADKVKQNLSSFYEDLKRGKKQLVVYGFEADELEINWEPDVFVAGFNQVAEFFIRYGLSFVPDYKSASYDGDTGLVTLVLE